MPWKRTGSLFEASGRPSPLACPLQNTKVWTNWLRPPWPELAPRAKSGTQVLLLSTSLPTLWPFFRECRFTNSVVLLWEDVFLEKAFGVEWGEECREFLVGGWVWESNFHFHFYFLGSVWLPRKLGLCFTCVFLAIKRRGKIWGCRKWPEGFKFVEFWIILFSGWWQFFFFFFFFFF